MFEKKLMILIFLIIPLLLSGENILKFGSNCLIHNEAFSYSYLHLPTEIKRENYGLINQICVKPLGKVKDFNDIRWSVEETSIKSGQYYLKSSQYEGYLCATNSFDDIWRSKRIVNRFKLRKSSCFLPKCKWNIIKVDIEKSNNTYSIRNVFYNESLYAVSHFFPITNENRKVHLWQKKNSNSKKQKWIIDCQTGNYLWI